MARSVTATPLPDSSRWMAAASDLLPSPGAPVTDGTKAATCSSRPMLPVAVLLDTCAAVFCLAGAARGSRPISLAPTPAGCPVLELLATAPWRALRRQPGHEAAGGLAGDRLGNRRRDRRPRILGRSVAGDDLLAGDAIDALAGLVGNVPDVGHLGAALVLGGDDVAAQRVVDTVVLGGRHGHALPLDGPAEFVLDLFGDAVGRADDRCNGHLGERRLRLRRLGRRDRFSDLRLPLEPMLFEPNKLPKEPPVSQPARPSPAQAIRTASATLGCRRRAAAASMVVTVTSPFSKNPH